MTSRLDRDWSCQSPNAEIDEVAAMNILREIKDARMEDELVVARLTQAYTLLAMAPYDNWGHEGTPAEMAVFVVKTARERGNMGFLTKVFAPDLWRAGI